MNEFPKTMFFVAAAVVVGLLAFVFRPVPFQPPKQQAGDRLFPDLEDASGADALEVVRYDPGQSEAVRLEVERDGDQWVIA